MTRWEDPDLKGATLIIIVCFVGLLIALTLGVWSLISL